MHFGQFARKLLINHQFFVQFTNIHVLFASMAFVVVVFFFGFHFFGESIRQIRFIRQQDWKNEINLMNLLICKNHQQSANECATRKKNDKNKAGLVEVIIYSSPDDRRKNRGFCFLEYDSHKSASLAKRRLSTGRVKIFGCDIIVDWADPQEEPDQDTMSKV